MQQVQAREEKGEGTKAVKNMTKGGAFPEEKTEAEGVRKGKEGGGIKNDRKKAGIQATLAGLGRALSGNS